MSSPTRGTAASQRALWGRRARDWADGQEMQVEPLYHAAFDAVGLAAGQSLLDAGCGAGGALRIAGARGARLAGLDATPELLVIARERVPEADLREGDLESLPFDDDAFDVVTGFNSFQFAGDPAAALREAARVARPRAPVVVATWGPPERCEAAGYLESASRLMPPAPAGAPGPFALSAEGALESLVGEAGLAADSPPRDVTCVWAYADEDQALRFLMSAGPLVRAIDAAGEDAVDDSLRGWLAGRRFDDGGYRIENVFRFLVASAPD